MKILVITNHSYMLWQFRRQMIAKLLERGEVLISTPFNGHEEDFEAMGCRCIRTEFQRRGTSPAGEWRLLQSYKKLLKAERPDLVITYSVKPNIYAGYLCGRMGIPYCANVQGLGTAFERKGLSAVVTMMYRTALRKARTVFFENREDAASFVERGILPPERQTICPGAGVDLDDFAYQPYPEEKGQIHFLYLGRFMREKGIDELLEAAERLHREFGERVVFDLVGFFEEDYQARIRSLEEMGAAVFHGFQENPRPWYARSHCVVLPSWHEGMSNVLLEAAATGRALICSDIPGCREAVEDGKTGFLVPARDSDALYRAMKKFLTITAEQRENMGRLGRGKMEAEFDRTSVVRKIVCLLLN